MTSLDQAIQYTQLFQDIELSNALNNLKQNPQELQRFLQASQDKLYDAVTSQKDDTIQKVYGDLERASDAESSIYRYHQRNLDLNRLQEQVYASQKNSADAVSYDQDLAKRQYEINQWSGSNKRDTLFIYSQLFIVLCTAVIFAFAVMRGILSLFIVSILGLIVILIFVFTIVNRAQYTNFIRDNRYWNRRKFPVYTPIPTPNICDSPITIDSIQKTATDWTKAAENQLKTTADSARNNIKSSLSSLANAF